VRFGAIGTRATVIVLLKYSLSIPVVSFVAFAGS
jgi:hypothetical protein